MASYSFEIEPDDNETFLITVPGLPEVATFSDTERDAHLYARKAIEEALAARIAAGRERIPAPAHQEGGRVVLMPLMTSLKVDLFNCLRESGMNRAELARRLRWHRNQVDRLFDLNHQSKTDQIEAAFNALGAWLDVNIKRRSEIPTLELA